MGRLSFTNRSHALLQPRNHAWGQRSGKYEDAQLVKDGSFMLQPCAE
jgi:hypothetical protein